MRLKLFSIGIFFFGLFTLFSYLVDINLLKSVDFDTTVRFQDRIPAGVDNLFSLFSLIGSFEITLITLLILLILGRRVAAGLFASASFAVFHLFEIIGKTVVENLPPPEFMLRTRRLIEFPQFHVRAEYSYPSGHSGRFTFLAVLAAVLIFSSAKIGYRIKIFLWIIIAAVLLIMLVSRIYLGEHWLSDVVGGFLLGAALSFMASGFFLPQRKKKLPL